MRRQLDYKDRVIKGLQQIKNNIQETKNFLSSIEGSEEANRNLLMAEFSIIEGIHQVRLIGKEESNTDIQSESSEK